MPSARPTFSIWISWASPTARSCEVRGANGSARLLADSAAPIAPMASGAMAVIGFRRAASEIAIDEAVVVAGGFLLRQFENLLVQRRQRAGRIGIAGIARERKGLAAAAAEIDFPELAALARLLHPAGAAIAIEGFRILPDPGDRMIGAHRFEFEPGDAFGGVAGQDRAGGRNVEELPAPAAHAFLWPQRVIVGNHVIDRERALQPGLRFLDNAARLLELLEGRHQRGAFLQGPAVILHIGDFEPVGV